LAVTLPALVLRGTRDSTVKADDAALLADRLSRGQLRELPGAGHLAVLEPPDETARQIEVFVRRSEAHSLIGAGRITATQASRSP
jgi:pimeloyl-ACP methyl ester carboxylesterase